MGFLTRLRAEAVVSKSPLDDYWYVPRGRASVAGVTIDEMSALTISTVYACVKAISEDLAALPLITYRRLERGKERAIRHPLYDLLHDRPNSWQSSFEWREQLTAHLLLWGNAYCLIVEGPRGFADQLIPLDPARMIKIEQMPDRSLRYIYRPEETGQDMIYDQSEIFHLRGLSKNGLAGLSVVAAARDSMGLAKATEEFGARLFGQGALHRVTLQHPGRLTAEAAKRIKADFNEATTGASNWHGTAVLEEGMTANVVSMSNEDSQFLETRSFQVEEIARWYGVPLMRIGHTEKATSWGTGIEQFELGYVKHTLMPWLKRWEQAITRDLILAPQTYFAEFNVEGLLRGDIASRFTAHRTAIMTGWTSRNEVREIENQNPIEGLDDFLAPQNMALVDENGDIVPINQPAQSQPRETMPERPMREESLARTYAYEIAARLVRQEITALRKLAIKHERRSEFETAAGAFYSEHLTRISESLHIEPSAAGGYVAAQTHALYNQGLEYVIAHQDQRITELASLALEGQHADAESTA